MTVNKSDSFELDRVIMKNVVVINEQHNLLSQQEELIRKKLGGDIEFIKIPQLGLDKEEIEKLAKKLNNLENTNTIIVSPIPLLLGLLACEHKERFNDKNNYLYIFHNDKREKKEINGVIRSVVASDGWELIKLYDKTTE